MGIRSLRRPLTLALVVAALLAGRPQEAWAKQDWWGWLEEFSGPGPFSGFEFSAEFMCMNLAERRSVPKAALANYAPLKTANERIVAAFTPLAAYPSARSGVTKFENLFKGSATKVEDFNGADLQGLLGELRKSVANDKAALADVDAFERAFERRSQAIVAAVLLGSSGDTTDTLKARSSREFTAPGRSIRGRSCRGAQMAIEKDRDNDRKNAATQLAFAAAPDLRSRRPAAAETVATQSREQDAEEGADDTDIVFARRDWQTGLVIGFGRYRSIENKLFDPDGSRTDEPQLTVIPLEFAAHSKLSSSIDVGAGFGIAFFRTKFLVDSDRLPGADPKNTAFYLIPLSVVVRPARLFTNREWASVVGYRVSLRYFGELTAEDFGRPNHPYKQNGGFVWGAAGFVDLVALVGR